MYVIGGTKIMLKPLLCLSFIHSFHAHSLSICRALDVVQSADERMRTAHGPFPSTIIFTIKPSTVLHFQLSCFGSRYLNERKDFAIQGFNG